MPQVKHALVVLAYNDNEAIKTFLRQTVTLPAVDKIILVDNCSTTGLYEEVTTYVRIEGLSEKVDCLQSGHNGGYAFGNNVGLRYAIAHYQPTYLSLSNADVTLNQEALTACMTALEEQEAVAFVAPRMLSQRPEKAYWPVPTYWQLVKENLIVLNALLKRFGSSEPVGPNNQDVGVIAGSYYMGKAETFQSLDFLDERTFLYGEENILGFKVRDRGLKNQILNNVTFEHHHSTSINASISSAGQRLDILKDSCHVYLKHYLHIGPLGLCVYDWSHWLGKVTYLGIKRLSRLFQN